MDNGFLQLGISVREDGLSWNESSSQRSKGRHQSADAHEVNLESDISPYGTPKSHTLSTAWQDSIDCPICKAFSLYFSSRSYLISWPPCPRNPLSLTSTEWSHGRLTLIAMLLEQKLVLVLTVLSSQVVSFERWSHQFSFKWWLVYRNWHFFHSQLIEKGIWVKNFPIWIIIVLIS